MKRYVLLASVLIIAASCTKTPSAHISGKVASLEDTCIVLQRLDFNNLQPVDTIVPAEDGSFECKVELQDENPAFYYFFDGDKQIAAAVLLPNDNVNITVDEFGLYEVSGSEESQLLREIDEEFSNTLMDMAYLADQSAMTDDREVIDEINHRLSRDYVQYKRKAISHIMNHPKSITSALVAFQRINDNLPVFDESNDVILFRQLYDSLQTVYPKSPYVTALMDDINRRDVQFKLEQKVSQMTSINYPELNLPDINGQSRILSDLDGKVIILSFWSVEQTKHKMFNNDLKEVYGKYHNSGLEIYQVSFDIDKPSWAAAVNNQQLPWVSVNDGLGAGSPARSSYNITKLPAMFIIDREGNIVGKDIYDAASLEALVKKYL